MAGTPRGRAADVRPVPGGLPGHLVDFVEALRGKGIAVGPSEAVDAAEAVLVIDLLDRDALREALAATLIRRPSQRPIFDQLFDLWFPRARGFGGAAEADDLPDVELPRDADGKVDAGALEDLIVDLLSEDTPEATERARALVELMVEQMGRYESTRGPSFSSFQTLGKLDASSIARRLVDGLIGADPGDPDGRGRLTEKAAAANAANERVKGFFQQVADEVRRRTAEHSGRDRVARTAIGPDSEHVDFLRANDADLQRLRAKVGPLARQLGNRLAARRKRIRRGDIDMRRTMRRSMSTGGVPMELVLRRPRKARPELVVLCDVSGSVAGFSHFTLQLVHSLREQFSRVRVFAFVDTVDEVTDYFATGDDLAAAMARMVGEAEIVTYDGHSDYGHAFRGFAERYAHTLSPSSSVLVLGDGRNNYRDPALEAVELLTERARHVHWLNPEPKEYWGTSDSATPQYGEFVPMHECRNIAQLATVVSQLLPV